MKTKKIEGWGVFDENGNLLSHDPIGQGLYWKYPAIFGGFDGAELFRKSHRHRGKFVVNKVTIKYAV